MTIEIKEYNRKILKECAQQPLIMISPYFGASLSSENNFKRILDRLDDEELDILVRNKMINYDPLVDPTDRDMNFVQDTHYSGWNEKAGHFVLFIGW